jgi:Fe-Mn family superoxide dismutase
MPRSLFDLYAERYPFALPPLGYAPTAVEPAVDAATMALHHDKHHAAYVTNLNTALKDRPELHQRTLGELLMGIERLPPGVQLAVRNQGGGHANHALFWQLLAPRAPSAAAPTGRLAEWIVRDFGSVDACKAALKAAGVAQFGSGWAWLVKTATNHLVVKGLPNQDSPLMQGELPVVGVDVWEHAYYLKYQNRRAEYLDALLARINWEMAGTQLAP